MMKAIETVYDGYKFRSRLEARWAVFFNVLGVKYEYEKEGYDLDGTYYLPDFWLPEQKYWIEIKGNTNAVGYDNVFKLSESTGCKGFVISGEIPYVTNESDFSEFSQIDPGSDEGYTWCECPDCRGIGIEWNHDKQHKHSKCQS